jgi:hypothetical protein
MLPKIIVATQFKQIIRWKQIFIHDGTTDFSAGDHNYFYEIIIFTLEIKLYFFRTEADKIT